MTHAERVEQARQAWNNADLDGYLTLYDESIQLHGYGPEPFDKSTVAGFSPPPRRLTMTTRSIRRS